MLASLTHCDEAPIPRKPCTRNELSSPLSPDHRPSHIEINARNERGETRPAKVDFVERYFPATVTSFLIKSPHVSTPSGAGPGPRMAAIVLRAARNLRSTL